MNPFDARDVGRAIFAESMDALFLFDPQTDQVLDVNPTAERLTSQSRAQLLAQPCTYWVRFAGEERGGMNRFRQAASKSNAFFSEDGFYLRTAQDDVWIPVNLTVARLHVQPKTLALMTARDIREQRATRHTLREKEAKLREEEIRLQAILDHSPAVIYLKDLDGRYLFINRRHEALFHISREGIRGKTVFDIYPPDIARPLQAHDRQVLDSGLPLEVEEVVPQDDGLHTYISNKFPLRDQAGKLYALCGISTDITERIRVEEERNRFFNLSLDMLCIAGFDGYFKRVNPAWEKTLGWRPEELLSRPYLDFVHPDDQEATRSEAARAARGDYIVSFENRYRCPDGSYKWLLWTAAPLSSHELVYAAARDITQRKEAENQLAATADELTRAYQQARELAADLEKAVASERQAHQQLKKAQSRLVQSEKLVALGQMVAGVAHEINNPLTFITNNFFVMERDVIGLRDLIKIYAAADPLIAQHQPELSGSINQLAQGIDLPYTLSNLEGLFGRSRDGLKRIQQIVKDLRSFARMDEGDLHEVNLNTGIESTINIVAGQAKRKKINLVLDLGKLPLITCYPAKINQVVMNLVANAIDACGENGEVTIRSRAAAEGVEIHVFDNGPGIPPHIRDRIFDPFFTTKPPGKGTGLGLSISHGIVEDHGGRIEVETSPAQGAHLTVLLPLKPPVKAEPEKPS